jgi:hypothetical protein
MRGTGWHPEQVFVLHDRNGKHMKLRFDSGIPADVRQVAGVLATDRGTEVMTWLIGLALALRGSQPADRPAILRAYVTCRPWSLSRTRPPIDPRRSVRSPS